jgi:hypothetical protein
MLTNFEKTLIVYGGMTGTQENTRDSIFTLNLENKIWTKTVIFETNEQFSNFSYQKLAPNELLIFGGQNFLE